MGWLDTLFGGLISTGQQIYNNEFNKREAEKNRQFQSEEAETARLFNANEAALQRDWSSQEAERARDWNEEMYEKYNSLSGKIHQAELAGVNPMFAVTGNAVSPISTSSSAPSGASASGGSPSGSSATSSFVDIVGSILGMAKLKAEIDNIKADSKEKESRANKQDKDTSWVDRLNSMSLEEAKQRIAQSVSTILSNEQNIAESNKRIESLAADILATNKDIEVKSAQIAVLFEQVATEQAKRVQMSHQNDLTDKQREEISKNIEYLGAKITEVTQQTDFFDKVRGHRENLEKARGDNASIAEKLSALSPVLGKMDFPYNFNDEHKYDKSNYYKNQYKKYLDTYIDIMIEVANSK